MKNKFSLNGRRALLLGASKGLGFASAVSLAEQGAKVIVTGRSKETFQQSMQKAKDLEIEFIESDLQEAASRQNALSSVLSKGPVDILVVCGGGPAPGKLLDLEESQWTEAFSGMALSFFEAVKAVVPGMKKQSWGRIIHIGSLAVREPIAGLDLSNFMRSGIASLLRTLSWDLASDGINVHMVMPGGMLTDRSRERIQARADKQNKSFEDALADSNAQVPVGRLGKPEELGDLVAFLSSSEASYLTGLGIPVDGGRARGTL